MDPLCRFCLEPSSDPLNPLISPCPCSGTVQFVHRACLYRWIFMDTDEANNICSICKTPFLEDHLPKLEVIPPKDRLYFFLDNSTASLLLAHYVICFILSNTLRTEDFLYHFLVTSQISVNVTYMALFLATARVKNWQEYISVSYVSYAWLITYHLLSLFALSRGMFILSIPLGASLNLYWRTHIKTLKYVNVRLLERFRRG